MNQDDQIKFLYEPSDFDQENGEHNSRHPRSNDEHHQNNKLHARSLKGRDMKKKNSVCRSFVNLSVMGIFLTMVGVFNCLANAVIMYDTINSRGGSTTTNSVSNANNNDNQDTNNDNNENINLNYNDNYLDRQLRESETEPDFKDFEDFIFATDGEEKPSSERSLRWRKRCPCRESRAEDSWLSTAGKKFEGVWASAGDFLTENPECASRMACEVASPFVTSSMSPYLAVLPSRMAETRSILMSSASGDCAAAYDRCPVSLNPIISKVTQWL
ncbi:uncharacterized protein [Palaemon carinicauda]|uniref:uncharacterized protein n=1 Tax=Palaemon carinicauda TaxID=392227 RepID=UPI0035B5FC6A